MSWLNADQVAERLQISRRTALSLMYQMPHSVIGGTTRKRIRVSEESLDMWMLKQSNVKSTAIRSNIMGSNKRLGRR